MSRRYRRNFSRRLINALATAAINLGIGPPQRHLLTVVSRKTRMPLTTPVSVVDDGAERYLVGPYGEVGWVRNARGAGIVTLSRGGRSERFSLVRSRPRSPLRSSNAMWRSSR